MKIEKNSQIINPFGAINFVVESIKNSGTLDLIDNQGHEQVYELFRLVCYLILL